MLSKWAVLLKEGGCYAVYESTPISDSFAWSMVVSYSVRNYSNEQVTALLAVWWNKLARSTYSV